ncbi:stage IV sporulation protein [Clostridium pasteurianum DSM 525 = ATCC 6013]|uniref:Sporulation protein YqfD n=1 Tax=Clostridium pasteurianum DSM 525 = ATCC 6013 TaxID=1262449 RepID=A0A0H3J5B3_CLOPA|nr:sporulation protein YqfD [Clostridium pasteurianum]AJA48372.1 stage IV sporulation protein [Clostridium pasteurianum DSM 525 = ATCC 6013]AJA52360.1 stage IV sporulation protein [Clostridium pasteurianum DSM 525 = ATCC 6013]AOZ75618.1 stage IV sporulation protein [Clostridium pasteurianum DSM 525 = ATCC 6013]AOZ79414.1 stage IV sporulation protein [Clostridium pasteurianum]ELP60478.1 stage IV sporulation protein [Clostridium pasteurianum DSM 525 = ATCC 6013]
MGNKFNFREYKNGTITVQLQSKQIERIINILWSHGIVISNIKRNSINVITFDTSFNNYYKVKDLASRTNSKIKILNRRGMIFLKIKVKRRISMVIGVFLFIGIISYLSNYIWGIDITTEKNIAPYEIREELKNIGITPGINKKKINVYDIEEKLKTNNDNIMWVRVRIQGSKLKVTTTERQAPPEVVRDDSPCDLMAKKDGQIVRIYTKAGTSVVKPGDIVKKGQIIVKGEQGNEGSEYEVHASGSVIAKIYYEETRTVSLLRKEKNRTGNQFANYYISILGKKFYLKNSLNKFAKYDKIEENNNFIKKEMYYETQEKNIKEDPKVLVNKTADSIYKNILMNFDKSVDVIDKSVESSIEGNTCRVRVLVTTEENIAEDAK